MRAPRFFLFLLAGALLPGAAANTEMNGYTLKMFGDFVREWRLVTVRYRKDTGEMRWTYANESAWKALSEGKGKYPDGAVFAKVGMMTKEDPSFPSSAVPSGARRVQFMVREAKKHAVTDGWGYALFDAKGEVFPGDLNTASIACAACHRLVPEKGYVFSEPMGESPFGQGEGWRKLLGFEDRAAARLPAGLRKLLGGAKKVRVLKGGLSENPFHGTLDEVRPLLAREAAASGLPAALVSKDGALFSVVVPESGARCPSGERPLKGMHTVPNPSQPIYEIQFCQKKE